MCLGFVSPLYTFEATNYEQGPFWVPSQMCHGNSLFSGNRITETSKGLVLSILMMVTYWWPHLSKNEMASLGVKFDVSWSFTLGWCPRIIWLWPVRIQKGQFALLRLVKNNVPKGSIPHMLRLWAIYQHLPEQNHPVMYVNLPYMGAYGYRWS